jgi:hypothetical protein
MDTRAFRSTLETYGLNREVSDAIVDLVEGARQPFVTNEKLELELTKFRSEIQADLTELRTEMAAERAGLKVSFANLRTEFAEHTTHTTRLVLGTSGALGLLMVMLRFLPA